MVPVEGVPAFFLPLSSNARAGETKVDSERKMSKREIFRANHKRNYDELTPKKIDTRDILLSPKRFAPVDMETQPSSRQ